MGKNNIIAGLEIGHTKLRMTVGELFRNGDFELLGNSEVNCRDGIKNGMIINLESVAEGIVRLLEDITQKTGKQINSVFVNITGLNVKQQVVNSVIILPQRGCEITKKNLNDLIESCKLVSIPLDESLLYISPLEYIIDGQDGIKEPIGLCGSRLEARILIITAPFNQVQNILKTVNSAGLEVEEVVLTALANASAILTEDEEKNGVILVDFKTDMTEISIFKDGRLVFYKVVSKGQADLTSEIASAFGIPIELAEDLKIRYAVLGSGGEEDRRCSETIPVDWMGIRKSIQRGELNRLIEERTGLIFELISQTMRNFLDFNDTVKKGMVVTGGVTAMEGFLEMAGQRFNFAVRKGDDLALSSGLVRYGLKKKSSRGKGEGSFFKKLYQKAEELLTEYF